MHVATKTKVWTLEELHSLPDDGNKYEPDLMVRPPWPGRPRDWDNAPRPILIVEVLSAAAGAGPAVHVP
jgi:Uma2 family endonuclease